MAGGGEVVTESAEVHSPYRIVVSLIAYHIRSGLDTPKSCFQGYVRERERERERERITSGVLGASEEELIVGAEAA